MWNSKKQTDMIQRLCSENKPLGNLRLPRGKNFAQKRVTNPKHLNKLVIMQKASIVHYLYTIKLIFGTKIAKKLGKFLKWGGQIFINHGLSL